MLLNKPHPLNDPRELAARLSQRITIERASEVSDNAGGTTISWATLATIWAEMLPHYSGSRERPFAEQLQAEVTHRITIRYRSDITPADRIRYAGRLFNIRSIINVGEADIVLQIMAEEGVAA